MFCSIWERIKVCCCLASKILCQENLASLPMQLILYFCVWPRGKYRQVLSIVNSAEVSVKQKTKAKFRVFLSNKVYFYGGTHVNKKTTYFAQEKVKLKTKLQLMQQKTKTRHKQIKKPKPHTLLEDGPIKLHERKIFHLIQSILGTS